MVAIRRFLSFVASATLVTTLIGHDVIGNAVEAFGANSMSSPAARESGDSMNFQSDGPVVLLVGSCGLDRLLTVSSYPAADSKIRTTSYNEVGGGNTANTASGTFLYGYDEPSWDIT